MANDKKTWEDVEKIYYGAIRDLESLELPGAECPLGTPPALAKKFFEDRFSYYVEEKAGNPDRVYDEIFSHASSIIMACARMSAGKMVTDGVVKESGRGCWAKWTWSPTRGECYLTSYDPVTRKTMAQHTVSCPKKEEAHVEANVKALRSMGEKDLTTKCLIEARGLVSQLRFEDDKLILEKMWDLKKMVEDTVKTLKERWEGS